MSSYPMSALVLLVGCARRRACLLVLGALLAAVAPSAAVAQAEPDALAAPVRSPADGAWSAVATLLAEGRFDDAESALRAFRSTYPDDDRAPLAESLANALHDALARPAGEVRVTSQAGRLELATFSTLWGAVTGTLIGFEIADAIDSDDGKVPLWTAMGGGGAGLALSLVLTADDPPTRSQASLISSAGVWGYAVGAELAFGSPISVCRDSDFWGRECEPDPSAARMIPIAVSAASVVGAVVYGRMEPNVPLGDIAVVNASGAWGFGTALAIMAAAEADSPRRPADFMLAGTTIGLATGLALTPFVTLSRSRMWLINLSGALGTGLAAAITATTETEDERTWGLAILAGETAGLTTGALVTVARSRTRRRERDVAFDVVPAPVSDGRSTGMGFALSGSW